MRAAGTAFVASMLVGGALTPAVRRLAHRFGALDHALSSRKVHRKPIPRLGGIAIVLAFYAPLVGLFFTSSEVGRQFYAHPEKAVGLFAGGLVIAGLGVYDDLVGARASEKLLLQFAVSGFAYWIGFRIDVIANPFGSQVHLGAIGLPFTMLWITGVVNAINLIDGLDGLAGGVALIAIATTFAVSVFHAEPLMVLTTAALAGAVLGFLFYNFNPASIFMGDTGSMFLGFVLATTAIQTNQKSSTAVAIIVPIIALGIPIADTLLAMARRALRGVPVFSADKGHIHHRLLARGFSQREAVLVLYGASILLGAAALVLSFSSSSQATLVLLVLSAVGYVSLKRLGFFGIERAHELLVERRRNLLVRRELRRIGAMLRQSTSVEEVWGAVRVAKGALGADTAALFAFGERVGVDDVRAESLDETRGALFRARYPVFPERLRDAYLEFGWGDGRTMVERDLEIGVELLCDLVAQALDRLQRARPPLPKVANIRR